MTKRRLNFSKQNRWRLAVTDPVLFCREFLEFDPHPGQELWLRNSNRDQNLLVTGNRWGKSTIQAAKMLHRAIFQIRDRRYDSGGRYRIMNLSITQDQADIVFKNCLQLIRGHSLIELLIEGVVHTPYPKITFGNGAEIVARSSQNRGEHVLGHDFDLISFDEVAFELHPEYVVDEILTMRLADRHGQLDLISTPRGKNWFYRKFLQLQIDLRHAYVQTGCTIDNPHLSQEFLLRKLDSFAPQRIAQNLEGLFIDSGEEILREEYIQRALAQTTGLSPRLVDHRYITGWDLARKLTYTVGITLDVTTKPWQIVKLDRFNHRDWPFVYAAIRQRKRDYGGDTIIDSTGVGDAVVSELADIRPLPFIFTEKSKADLLTSLQTQFESGNIAVPDIELQGEAGESWRLVDELRELNWNHNNHCDAAMALALCVWGAKLARNQTPPEAFRLGKI